MCSLRKKAMLISAENSADIHNKLHSGMGRGRGIAYDGRMVNNLKRNNGVPLKLFRNINI